MHRLPSRALPVVLVVVAALALGIGAVARPGAQDASTPTSAPGALPTRSSVATEPRPTTCPGTPGATAPIPSAPATAESAVVGLDEASHRYTDAIYGWSVSWDPTAWPSGVWASIDHDGYPVLNLAGAPPLCTPWEPGFSEREFRHAERFWRVTLRSTDAAHPLSRPYVTGDVAPDDPASCLASSNTAEIEVVSDAAGRPLREVTADRAWEVVENRFLEGITYRECRVLVPGVALLAITAEIATASYPDQAPRLATLLATIQIPAAGAWTPAPVPTPMPTPTVAPRPVSDEAVARLTILGPGESTIQLRAGEARDLDLGVVECCYLFFPVPVAAVWSVSPAEGATIDPGTGVLTIDPTTPSGRVFVVSADVENGRRVVTAEVHVFTPEANPLVGLWRETAQVACGTEVEVAPDHPILELVFRADGTFSVTWQPFELYTDYWGTYRFDPARETLELTVDGGNYVPPDVDGSGGFAADGTDTLLLTDLWLGTSRDGTGPPACGHRLVRPGSAAAERAAATPDRGTAVTPGAATTSTPATVPGEGTRAVAAGGTPTQATDGACFIVRDRPTFPALVRPDGAVAGECGPPTDPDVRAFLAVEAVWTGAAGPERALVNRVEVAAGESADFGLVVNVEGGPRAVPLRAGERWSVAACAAGPPGPATPAATATCAVPDQASREPVKGARIDPVTGVLTVDPATPAGRRFAVSAAFTVEDVRHERSVEVLVVPGAGASPTPAGDPSKVLLRAPVVLPPGPLAVRVARHRYDGGSASRLDATAGPVALVVEAGRLDVEVAGPAILFPPNAPPDASGELLVPGQGRSLGPGDQVVVAGSGGLTARNAGGRVAEALVVRFAGGGGPVGTPEAADGISVTVLVDGELAGVPAGPTSMVLNRFDLEPGGTYGPIGIVVGHGFFAAEAGTLALDLTEGAGTIWQGGATRPLAPGDGGGPEAVLAPGDTALVEPGTRLTLANPGPDPLVGFNLIVRLPSAAGGPALDA